MSDPNVKEDLIDLEDMRSKEQEMFIKRLNELLPHGEATIIAQRTRIHLLQSATGGRESHPSTLPLRC